MSGVAAPRDRVWAVIPGLLVCAILATGGFLLADLPWVKSHLHVSALLLVILLGMAIRSVVAIPAVAIAGVRRAQRPVLRWAVAGLGFRLSLLELWKIGAPALGVVVISTATALGFGWWIARRLGVSEKLGLLLGVGGAICGASAVVAADSVVQGEKRDSALAMGVITLLGTIGIVIYPLLGRRLGMGDFLYGVWDGASLHEMAQVVAAGFGQSEEAARVATVVKLARIALLAPVVFGLSAWLQRRARATQATGPGTAHVSPVPWFLVLFLLFALVNSAGVIPAGPLDLLRRADLWLLCVGMAGVGLQTGFGDLKEAGWAPVLAGSAQWLFLSATSYGLARVFCR
jgi:uncharacterized integral membrane protein (TIGR00698 family)